MKKEDLDILERFSNELIKFNSEEKQRNEKVVELTKLNPLLPKRLNDVEKLIDKLNNKFLLQDYLIVQIKYLLLVNKKDNEGYTEIIQVTTAEEKTFYRNVTCTSIERIDTEVHCFVGKNLEALLTDAEERTAEKFLGYIPGVEHLKIVQIIGGAF